MTTQHCENYSSLWPHYFIRLNLFSSLEHIVCNKKTIIEVCYYITCQ